MLLIAQNGGWQGPLPSGDKVALYIGVNIEIGDHSIHQNVLISKRWMLHHELELFECTRLRRFFLLKQSSSSKYKLPNWPWWSRSTHSAPQGTTRLAPIWRSWRVGRECTLAWNLWQQLLDLISSLRGGTLDQLTWISDEDGLGSSRCLHGSRKLVELDA